MYWSEATWKHVKVLLSLYNGKANYVHFLAEYMFRQKCKAEESDPFSKFVEIVATIDWSNNSAGDGQWQYFPTCIPSSTIHPFIVYCMCVCVFLFDVITSLGSLRWGSECQKVTSHAQGRAPWQRVLTCIVTCDVMLYINSCGCERWQWGRK